mgnify:CR=1 FL=1
MKSALILLIGLVLGAAGVIGGYFYFSTREAGDDFIRLVFTEAEIQEKLGREFPQEKEVLRFFKIVIEEPQVTFTGGKNRLQIAVDATFIVPLIRKDRISGVFEGSIRYEKNDQTLRVSEFEVASLNTEELPEKYEGPVRAAFNLASKKFVDDRIIHTIEKDDLKGKAAELFLKEVIVKDDRLEVVLGL